MHQANPRINTGVPVSVLTGYSSSDTCGWEKKNYSTTDERIPVRHQKPLYLEDDDIESESSNE
jgi:hypothetical protein